ncbi:MAG TPA: 2OG-Fe(II) oxygenase [Rhizomicrobium sp.]
MAINTFAVCDDVFAPQELDGLAQLGDRLVQRRAQVTAQGQHDPALRITQVAWITPEPEHRELFARIGTAVRRLNAQFFGFDITELEPLQYTVYHGAEGGHYGWHVDAGPNTPAPRKLSLSIQLSEPGAYAGCDLQFQSGPKIDTAPRTRGAVIAFPSFFLHRVTPILSGTRKALVVWANGPQFR